MSNFAALNTSLSGLRASQLGLDTASNNVSNANTTGYTRQRLTLTSSLPYASPVGPMGTGVTVEGVARLRDAFLDARVRTTLGAFAKLDTSAQLLGRAESILGEPDHGISNALGTVWNSFEDLAMDPSGQGPRRQVIGALETLTSRVRDVAVGWQQLQTDTEQRLEADLAEVNQILASVNELNRLIPEQAADQGGPPNALYDQRDNHLDRLAELTGATFTTNHEGTVQVAIGGQQVAMGIGTTFPLLTRGAPGLELAGAPVTAGGQIGATVAFVDVELPAKQAHLDAFANHLISMFNTQQHGDPPVNADPLLVGTGAADLRVDPAMVLDPGLLRAGLTDAKHDGDNALAFANLRRAEIPGEGRTLEQSYQALSVGIASDVASAKRGATAQHTIAVAAQSARYGMHSVSLDEEMTDVVRFQRSLEAMSRVMTAVDEALNVLINRTGVVGR